MCQTDGSWTLAEPSCYCNSPISIQNGQVVDDGGTAEYTCNKGFSMSGLPTRACVEDGSGWNGVAPICNTCATLSTPIGGSVVTSTDGINTWADYNCDSGWTLDGPSTITCRSDGTWDFTEPSCAKCPDLLDPDSGKVSLATTSYITTATFTCRPGYYLKGQFSITCGSDGTWSDDVPTCECNFPTQPANGQVTLSGTGTVASYRCDNGYTLNGLSARTCQTDGTGWEGSEPQCILCKVISNPASGSFTLSTNGTHTVANYACAVGTSLNGFSEIMCDSDGIWTSSQPVCVDCAGLSDPDSGYVTLSTNGLTTSAVYSCVSGYTLNSTSVLQCLSAGVWDLPPPFCICQSPPLISNGQLNISSDLRVVSYTCNVGYVLVGSVTRTCRDDGTGWDGIAPVCDTIEPAIGSSTDVVSWSIPLAAIIVFLLLLVIMLALLVGLTYLYCSLKNKKTKIESMDTSESGIGPDLCIPLNNPAGGTFTLSSDGLTTTANYSCVVGYTLVGSNERKCQQNKFWTSSPPTCVQCDGLNDLPSGEINISTDGFRSTAFYSCVSGYTLVGMTRRWCLDDGSWNETAPVCDCNHPSAPINGAVVATGKLANYTCNVNYTLLGKQIRTCQSDGTGWDDGDPQCILCQTAPSPIGGMYTLWTTGTQTYALYYCENGYTLSGTYKVYCQFTGAWDTIPTCVKCATLVAPDSGSVTTTTTGKVTMATYSCSAGYNLNGGNLRSCLPDGTWDSTAPNCTCHSPLDVQNGHVIDDGITATYSCDVGYSLHGSSVRACAKDGSWWSGADPVCNSCTTLTSPTGGTVTLSTNGLVTIATYTCHVGYTLNGLDNITCRSGGTWDFNEPDCVPCPTLSDPGSGSVIIATDTKTTTATFNCVTGYYVNGPLQVTCQTSGDWSSEPPTCKCTTPDPPAHGEVSVSDTTQGPVANYECQLDYSINGMTSRPCTSDGSGWEGTDPSCSFCDSITTSPEQTFVKYSNGSTTSGRYACTLNYTLSGEDVHTCLSDGKWNHQIPSCVSCSNIGTPPLSGHVIFETNGLNTRAIFTCVFGYELTSGSILTCQTDGSWDLPEPLCVCKPPEAVVNGHFDLLLNGILANYSCDVGYELVGPQQRSCLTDGTGWNGTEPRCDLIITTPSPSSPDETVLPIPTAAFIALVLLIIILVIALVLVAVCSYLRYRKDRQRIGTTFDSADSRPISSDEARFNFESPDIEVGSLLIMKDGEPAKSTFDKRLLKNKSSLLSIELSKSKSGRSDTDRNGSIPRSDSEYLTGTPPHVPLSAVRLPALPPKPAKKREATRHKRKRRRVERPEDKITGSSADESKPRTSTPTIETIMSRTQTPDILSSETFEYIQPVYCPEVATPAPSRPGTATSRAGSRPPTSKSRRKINENESNV